MVSLHEVGPGYMFLAPRCTKGHCQRKAVLWVLEQSCGATSEDK